MEEKLSAFPAEREKKCQEDGSAEKGKKNRLCSADVSGTSCLLAVTSSSNSAKHES